MRLPFLPQRYHRLVFARQRALGLDQLAGMTWRCLSALRALDPTFDLFRGYDLDYTLIGAEHEDALRNILGAAAIDWYDRDRPANEPAYRARLATASSEDFCDLLLSWVEPPESIRGRMPLALELRLGAADGATSAPRAALLTRAFACIADIFEPDVARSEHPSEPVRTPHGSSAPSVGWLTFVPATKLAAARAAMPDLELVELASGAAVARATAAPPAWDKEHSRIELVRARLMPILEGRTEVAAAAHAAPLVEVAAPTYLQQGPAETAPPPVAVRFEVASGASAGALVWRRGESELVTFVIKLVLDLRTGQLSEARPVVQTDVFGLGDATRSVLHANELVPFLKRGEIVVTGSAEVALRQSRMTSLQVAGDTGVIRKQVIVRATGHERTNPARIPLQYELAFGGPGFPQNPVGLGYRGTGVPSLLAPNGWLELVGYGPLSPTWSDRADLLSRGDRALLARRPLEVPAELSWDYFHAAPADQRLDTYFRGNEVITLDGFRDHPVVLTLPKAAAMAMLESEQGARDPVQMQLDHVAVDLDEMVAWLVFRGCADASEGRLGSRVMIHGAYALDGQVRWPSRSRAAQAIADEQTAAPDGAAPPPAVPFRPGDPTPSLSAAKPPWSETVPTAPPATPELGQTVELPARKKT